METDPETHRLHEDSRREKNWKRWGPYLAERQWGTVREDYSADGDVWNHFPHDQARSRTYRWGEDGLLGITDRECRLCFGLALWNGKDPILKERLFGLNSHEGNHGEDVKECYYYLDSTPTHSYMKGLYKYPQSEFPYEQLVEENGRRGYGDYEFEILDTDAFEAGRYFDVFVEYAKNLPNDILIRVTAVNRAAEPAELHLLPTLWFRNSWSWGCKSESCWVKPRMSRENDISIVADHATLERFHLQFAPLRDQAAAKLLFTDNETNSERLYGSPNSGPFVKDAFHDYVIHGRENAVNPRDFGTKAAIHQRLRLEAGQEITLNLRLVADDELGNLQFGPQFDAVFEQRKKEADAFFAKHIHSELSDEQRGVSRQAFAGLLWTKQYYHYVVREWLEGDPDQPAPPPSHKLIRNHDWENVYNRDIISMPDKWEYPWYAAWDLAFHMLPMATIDPEFAKEQLILFLREWYMHPNGQLPAYEFQLGDVNPPVHAWACWRVYKMTGERGMRDRKFLARVYQKLMLNFTWWINRKDLEGKNIFAGGFLGLDNIGIFDRSQPLPMANGHLDQADGTAWMAFFCSTMLSMAIELAPQSVAYEDLASKFFEHFISIADAINSLGGSGLWHEEDGFYYDQIRVGNHHIPLRLRSMVGIIPIFATGVLDSHVIDQLPGFKKRMDWFIRNRQDLCSRISYLESKNGDSNSKRLLAIPTRERLVRVLKYVLDENEFLSPYGIRSLSKIYEKNPFVFQTDHQRYEVRYAPAESNTGLFGGNSNWRGPVWMPLNYLLIEALERYHYFFGDDLKVEFPTGSGEFMNLEQVAHELSGRLVKLFLPDKSGRRPVNGDEPRYAGDPHWRDYVLFFEYFDGDTGRGIGASHQTGWTSLVTRCLEDIARYKPKVWYQDSRP